MRFDAAKLDTAIKGRRIRFGRRSRRAAWCVLHPTAFRVSAGEGWRVTIDGHPAGIACDPCCTFVALSSPLPKDAP